MDKIDICKGVELCLDASNIYILNDGKRKDLTNKSGKVLNSLYYLFGQYLEEHEISFDFKDNLDMIGISNINVMSKQFMNLHILENNHDGRVLSDCGNNLVEKIIGYVSENSGVYDSIKNLRYLGLFDKCQNLIGDGGCEELNPDTKIFDTYPEDTIDSAPVSPVAEMLIDESVVTDPVDDADFISDNPAKVNVDGKDDFSNVENTDIFKHSLENYLLTYDVEKDGKFYFFIDTNGEIFPLAVDLLSFALHTMVPDDAEVVSSIKYRNLKTANSPTKLKNIGFLDSNKNVTDVAITYIEESLIPMFEKFSDKELLDFEVKYKYERYLFLRKKFSEIDFEGDDPVLALSVKEPADDDYHVLDSVDAVDPTEAEDDVVSKQSETDASAYPLSHEEIKLAIGRDILVWDGDRLVVTDEGRKHEIFMKLYGDKIDALNNSDVSDVPEEVLYTEDLDKAYYSIAERTDKYEGVSIFFEGNEVPIVTLKIYDEGKKMLLSPQIYALNIICMADKLGVELTKDLLEDKLELFAYSSAKHWASLLEVDGCITYDDGILKPGQKLRDVVDLANTYIEGKYESFEEPIQIKYVPYPRIKKLLTHKDIFSISGDQTVLGIKDRASNNSGVQFSDSKPIHRPRDNKQGNFNRSADKPEGISGIESNNGDLTITYYGHDGSGADKESLPVKRLQVNDTLTPAGERINMDNGNSADSIVDALKEFKLLDSIGDLNEYGELLSKKMNMDWNSIL